LSLCTTLAQLFTGSAAKLSERLIMQELTVASQRWLVHQHKNITF